MISLGLTLLVLGAASYWRRGTQVPIWLARLLLITVAIRFAVPFVAVANETIYVTFMADNYVANQEAIQLSIGDAEAGAALPTTAKAGTQPCSWLPIWLCPRKPTAGDGDAVQQPTLAQRIQGWLLHRGDASERLQQTKEVAENAAEHIVRLMVVFLLQTLVLPLLLVWALVRSVGGFLQTRTRPAS